MMKFVYIALILALIAFGYFLVSGSLVPENVQEIPEGYHLMEDGTLMKNAPGMEGMGAMDEVREAMLENNSEDAQTNDPAEVSLENSRVIEVKGVNHAFDVEEIRVKKGETVTIQFESTDGFHDWVLDEFDAATDKVQPGVPTSVTFVADEEGTFEYYCSVGNHRAQGMVGSFIVE